MRHLKFLRFAIATALLSASITAAQEKSLSGIVKDVEGNPVGFSTVQLLHSTDKEIVTGSIADIEGRFTVSSAGSGNYFIKVSAMGFEDAETTPFELNDSITEKDLGTIILKPNVNQIKEVTIESLRPLITQEADKMVVRLEGTALAAGNTVFAVLSRMPGVFIDPEGNIRLNGRNGVTVMLDGRLTYLSAADLRNMLEAMPAENLKNIEIITDPPAKYDAEGTSGILNINLKKNSRTGINGSIYSGYTYNFKKQHAYNYGGSVNYKSGKWNTFLSVDDARRVGGRDATFTRIFYGAENTTYFNQTAVGSYENEGPPTVRLGADYSINDRNEIGVSFGFIRNTGRNEFLTETYIGNDPDVPLQFINADNFSKNTHTNLKGNLHYTIKLDTLGTAFSTDVDIVHMKNRGDSDFLNYFSDLQTNEQTQDILYAEMPSDFDIYSVKADYAHPFGNENQLEMGVKASRVNTNTDSRFYFNNDGLVLDPLRTNHFIYHENIFAAYFSWNGPLGKKFSLKAGLRAENTRSTGNSWTTGQVTKRDYIDYFPSVFLQQKVSDNYEINYRFSRRITRPNYGNLNPFRAYRDPYTWWEGNPYLRPQYTSSFSLAQTFKKIYSLTVSYDYDSDVIGEIPYLDVESATTVYTIGNVDHGQTFDVTALAPLKITKWWDSQNTLAVVYNEVKTDNGNGELENKQWSYVVQSNQTLKLPAEIKMELNILYQGPAANGLYRMDAMSRVDLSFKKSFFKKKLDVVLKGNDIFKGYRFYWTTDINGNVNDFNQYFRMQNVAVSLRYNFSRGEKVKAARTNNLEELNRI
ncbi:MAG TPA: outer membrane beta-barrel family protein [Flavobacterium sp.]|jgi:hypothetical protein